LAKKLKIGFVGCGRQARIHFQELINNPKVEIVAFCDIKKSVANFACKQYGTKKSLIFDNAQKMFKSHELDAVYFILPPDSHGIEFEAIDRKIPFFVEKPIDLNLDQAKEISESIKKSQLLTSVGYMNRYRNGVQKFRKLVQEDSPILILGGWVLETPKKDCNGWEFSKEKCGGQFHEMVTHSVDLARFLCGEVIEVFAYESNMPKENFQEPCSISNATVVNLKFYNGAVGTLWASFATPAGYREMIDLRLYCKRVAGIFEGWSHNLKLMYENGTTEFVAAESDIFKKENDAFVDAVITGNSDLILSSYPDALKTLKITLAANESLKIRKPVKI
jgi:predicted dehydrogenase